MLPIGEKYRLTGEQYNVTVEELKEVLSPIKDENGKSVKGKDGKAAKEVKLVWKTDAYCKDLESALKHITTKEINMTIGGELKDTILKIRELENELPKISLKVFEGAEVIKKPESNKKKQKKTQIEDDNEAWEIEYHNDFDSEDGME